MSAGPVAESTPLHITLGRNRITATASLPARTNYIAEIGGRQPMTVEEFVSRNREAFV
jgi:hypothetical protein